MRYLTLLLLFIVSQNISGQRPGTLDPSYGIGGISIKQVDGTIDANCFSLAIAEDGKKVVAGIKMINDKAVPLVMRLRSNGDMDEDFGIGGEVIRVNCCIGIKVT